MSKGLAPSRSEVYGLVMSKAVTGNSLRVQVRDTVVEDRRYDLVDTEKGTIHYLGQERCFVVISKGKIRYLGGRL